MQNCSNKVIIPYCICAIMGSIVTMQIGNRLSFIVNEKLKQMLIYVGEHTIAILTWHFVCFKIVSLFIVKLENLPIEMIGSFPIILGAHPIWVVPYTIIGLLLPLLIDYCSTCLIKSVICRKYLS